MLSAALAVEGEVRNERVQDPKRVAFDGAHIGAIILQPHIAFEANRDGVVEREGQGSVAGAIDRQTTRPGKTGLRFEDISRTRRPAKCFVLSRNDRAGIGGEGFLGLRAGRERSQSASRGKHKASSTVERL